MESRISYLNNITKSYDDEIVEFTFSPIISYSDAVNKLCNNNIHLINLVTNYIDDNFVIAGGFVLALIECMMNNNVSTFDSSDIDIFIMYNNELKLNSKILNIVDILEPSITSITKSENIYNIYTKNRKIQIIKNIYNNLYHLLLFFDLNCVKFALKNNKFYTLKNNLNFFSSKINFIDTSLLYTSIYNKIISRIIKYFSRGYLTLISSNDLYIVYFLKDDTIQLAYIPIVDFNDKIVNIKTIRFFSSTKVSLSSSPKNLTYDSNKYITELSIDTFKNLPNKFNYVLNFTFLKNNYGIVYSDCIFTKKIISNYNKTYNTYFFCGMFSKYTAKQFMNINPDYKFLLQIQHHIKGYRQFVPIKSFNDSKLLLDSELHIYEVILSHKPCKPYLDIEWIKNIDKPDNISKFLTNFKRDLIQIFNIKYNLTITSDNILITSAHSDKKYSFHVVIHSNILFNTNKHTFNKSSAHNLYLALIEFNDNYKNKLDGKVYTIDREFRCINSSKFGETRPFIKCDSTDNDLMNYYITNISNDLTYSII